MNAVPANKTQALLAAADLLMATLNRGAANFDDLIQPIVDLLVAAGIDPDVAVTLTEVTDGATDTTFAAAIADAITAGEGGWFTDTLITDLNLAGGPR